MENNNESGILKFLYNTVPGRVVLKILTSPIISKIGGAYMDSPISKIHIKNFIKNNGINMADYEKAKYHSFNECFTRKILPEKRPVEYSSDAFISPCDSRLSVYRIDEKSTFNIKRSHYKVADLYRTVRRRLTIMVEFVWCSDFVWMTITDTAMLTMARLWKISRLREYFIQCDLLP